MGVPYRLPDSVSLPVSLEKLTYVRLSSRTCSDSLEWVSLERLTYVRLSSRTEMRNDQF